MVAVNEKVAFKGSSAIVRFVGTTEFAPGTWVGLELDSPVGKNNGSVQGVEYFKCKVPGNYGVFVRPSLLESNSPVTLDVASIVNRLQQKLRDALHENSSLRESMALLQQELSGYKDELNTVELTLESVTVESEFLESQNATLVDKINNLSVMYDNLRADYDILKEELEIYKELEEAVRLQLPSEESILVEDFSILVQHNKRLELAYSSLESLMATKDKEFATEINLLKENLAQASQNVESYDATAEQLHLAQASIKLLQEQLEVSLELVLIVERLTTENETLTNKLSSLQFQVQELTELNEIDKALEAEHLQKEADLQQAIDTLNVALEKEKAMVASLISTNREMAVASRQELTKSPIGTDNEEWNLLNREFEILQSKHEDTLAVNASLQADRITSEELITKLSPSDLKLHYQILLDLKSFLITFRGMAKIEESPDLDSSHLMDVISLAISVIEFNWDQVKAESLSILINGILESVRSSNILKRHEASARIVELAKSLESILIECSPVWLVRVYDVNRLLSMVSVLLKTLKSYKNNSDEVESLIDRCSSIKKEIEKARDKDKLAFFDCELECEVLSQFNSETVNVADIQGMSVCLQKLHDTLTKALPTLPGPVQTIYSYHSINSSKKDKEYIAVLQNELETKQQQVQDILLHVELLKKNMALSLTEKDSEIKLRSSALDNAQLEIERLQQELTKVNEENLELDRQLKTVLELDGESQYHLIPFFEEKAGKSELLRYTTLIEEIQLLKRMLNPKLERQIWHRQLDWLYEPLYTKKKTSKGLNYIEQAHSTRNRAAKILHSVPKATSNSQRLHYLLI